MHHSLHGIFACAMIAATDSAISSRTSTSASWSKSTTNLQYTVMSTVSWTTLHNSSNDLETAILSSTGCVGLMLSFKSDNHWNRGNGGNVEISPQHTSHKIGDYNSTMLREVTSCVLQDTIFTWGTSEALKTRAAETKCIN